MGIAIGMGMDMDMGMGMGIDMDVGQIIEISEVLSSRPEKGI